MNNLATLWEAHGTKILGTLATIVATALLIDGLIPDAHMKYWLFANALLGGGVVKRGFTNTSSAINSSNQQSGFARPLMLAMLLAVAMPVAVVTLPGCATFQKMGFDQQLQFSIDSAAAVTRSVSNAYDAKLITQKQAQQYLALVKNARDLFAIAIELKDADVKSAEGQLQLANDILRQLQRYLTEVQS